MISTITTRFRGGSPLSDLFPHTFMFTALIFQYLNELVEGEFRYFTPPQAFHTVKVQCLKDKGKKTFYKVHLPVASENL